MPPVLLVSPVDEPVFPSNRRVLAALAQSRADLALTEMDGVISYGRRGRTPEPGPRFVIWPTGHRVFYDEQGRRVLGLDPAGTVLHECEWTSGPQPVTLARARVRLDSLLWIGVVPEATTHETVLDLACRPESASKTPEALRRMAAQAWGVPIEDLRYFFPDRSFDGNAQGGVRIRLKKDGLFLLEDDTFARPRFISYMGAMPWARIDLLNVVELFQSTLPGTGSAVLELIWGLCHDQRRTHGAVPLRYRGLPTYPSEPAYGLFSAFFRPEVEGGADPHELFIDPSRASQITWWLRDDPPWRYVDRSRRLVLTVQGGVVQKVTAVDDSAGVPYVAPGTRGGFASCQRTVVVTEGQLQLRDGEQTRQLPVERAWGAIRDTPRHHMAAYPFGWRAFFEGAPPQLDPAEAYSLALFYPDDEAEVGELSSQPFVLEQLYESLNLLVDLPARLARIARVLIDGLDAVAAGCIDHDYPRCHTVLYRSAGWAQKQAQALWDRAAQAGRLPAVQETRFIPADRCRERAYGMRYDLIYCWIPFALYQEPGPCERMVAAVRTALTGRGLAFVIGPRDLRTAFASHGLRLVSACGVEEMARLPLLTEHLRLHPRTRLNPALTVFLAEPQA